MSTSTRVSVLLFASYADAFGARRVHVDLAPPARVRDLVDAMRALPGGSRLPAEPLVAVNRVWAAPDRVVAASDEVALVPPVAGG